MLYVFQSDRLPMEDSQATTPEEAAIAAVKMFGFDPDQPIMVVQGEIKVTGETTVTLIK